ncbi:MAG: 2Fe-2S iron-sulfur cluster binding domain-containing protein [Deltaproteobacteria bacterium]|nr:2Fe-2S iron-sulfur cluster binding domain-containing protein [Deltaproteobacteria bacterium]
MENNLLELLTSISIVTGIGVLLAFLLELAGRYLADYGEKRILINNEKEIVVTGGSPLLATLKSRNIFIPSACGGKGTCAYCKVRVLEGGGPVLSTETPYLLPEELEQNIRLSCQVKVKEDLKIQIPEELFLVKQFRAKVVDITDLTHEIKGVRMDILSPEEGITFKPGQYVQLEVPKYEKIAGPEFRAYSISSDSSTHESLELVITKVPEGAVTTYVHEYLKKDDELTIYGPYGDFYLRESDRGILLIATGSGLAPMKSILHQIENQNILRETILFFGAKNTSDLYHFDVLKGFETRLYKFKFYPTLSRVGDNDKWEGERGRVTNLIEKYVHQNAPFDVYLCGAPPMIESCMELLVKKGIPEGHIYFDKFG